MATFKVGDRVKLVACERGLEHNLGATGTIAGELGHYGPPDLRYLVNWDDGCHQFKERPDHLAPLTPPAEDTWAADKVRELVKPKLIPLEEESEEMARGFVNAPHTLPSQYAGCIPD